MRMRSRIEKWTRGWGVVFLHYLIFSVAVAALIGAFATAATDDQPSGDAGIAAPMIAFCVALLLLLETFGLGGDGWHKTRGIAIVFFSASSAWFWIATSVETHPASIVLLGNFLFLWGVGTIAGLVWTAVHFIARDRLGQYEDT